MTYGILASSRRSFDRPFIPILEYDTLPLREKPKERDIRMRRGIITLTILGLCIAWVSAQPISQFAETGIFSSPIAAPVAEERASDVVALEFRSYAASWTRYFNEDSEGELRLNIDGFTIFPSEFVSNGYDRIEMPDLETEGFIDELIEAHDLVYDEQFITGSCDTIKLNAKSTDIFCVPGADDMPRGHIFLALYHPETFELVAVTSTIDNSIGGATVLGRLALEAESAQTRLPADDDGSTGDGGCGPYGDGQWIRLQDYQASGLNLSIVDEGVGNSVTDYQCVVPENGPPYLQAYYVAPGHRGGGNSGNSGGGKQGSGGNSGGNVPRVGYDDGETYDCQYIGGDKWYCSGRG